eukprot:8589899-Pyramimonas_sp.AAC.1
MRLFLIIDVDGFKLLGPRANLEKGWPLLQEASEGCPKGIEISRSIHQLTWDGELPSALDPPPPQVKKTPASGQQVRRVARTCRPV